MQFFADIVCGSSEGIEIKRCEIGIGDRECICIPIKWNYDAKCFFVISGRAFLKIGSFFVHDTKEIPIRL